MTEKQKEFGWGHFYPPPHWLLTCLENLGTMRVKNVAGFGRGTLRLSLALSSVVGAIGRAADYNCAKLQHFLYNCI